MSFIKVTRFVMYFIFYFSIAQLAQMSNSLGGYTCATILALLFWFEGPIMVYLRNRYQKREYWARFSFIQVTFLSFLSLLFLSV